MKRYLLTNPRFQGEAEIVYGQNGLLQSFNVSDTDMDANTIQAFKKCLPAVECEEAFKEAFTKHTNLVLSDIEITFKMFYKDWPYKRNAYQAEKLWIKMNKSDQVIAYYNKKDYIAYCKRQQSKFEYQPMMADRYLRQREFETDWKKLK